MLAAYYSDACAHQTTLLAPGILARRPEQMQNPLLGVLFERYSTNSWVRTTGLPDGNLRCGFALGNTQQGTTHQGFPCADPISTIGSVASSCSKEPVRGNIKCMHQRLLRIIKSITIQENGILTGCMPTTTEQVCHRVAVPEASSLQKDSSKKQHRCLRPICSRY